LILISLQYVRHEFAGRDDIVYHVTKLCTIWNQNNLTKFYKNTSLIQVFQRRCVRIEIGVVRLDKNN